MEELISILKNFGLEDAVRMEEQDRQFLAIKTMSYDGRRSEFYFPFVLANALVGYQLSST